MGNQIPKEEVNQYLIRIKSAIADGRYRIVPRRKNMLSMARVGVLPYHVKDEIFRLTYRNYFNGPEPERDSAYKDGEVLLFGCHINNQEFFIKIKIEDEAGKDFCAVISIHEPEKPIYYPYK